MKNRNIKYKSGTEFKIVHNKKLTIHNFKVGDIVILRENVYVYEPIDRGFDVYRKHPPMSQVVLLDDIVILEDIDTNV